MKRATWRSTPRSLAKGWIAPALLVLDDLFLAWRIANVSAELLQSIVRQR